MPCSRPTDPAIPAAAINTATPLTRPDEVFGKDNLALEFHRRGHLVYATGRDQAALARLRDVGSGPQRSTS